MFLKRLVFAVAIAATSQSACGSDAGQGGLNGPCERENDCMPGLSCSRGVCTSTVSGLDGGGQLADASGQDSDAF
jgi:hypothetical protein